MQAVATPPAPSGTAPPDAATTLLADIQQYQRDARQTIHKLMLHLTDGITGARPPEEDVHQARITTQRIRLALQAARDLLRLGPDGSAHRPPRLPRTPRQHPSSARTPAPTPRPSATETASKLLAAAGRAFGSDERTKAWTVSSGAERMKTGSDAVSEGQSSSSATQSVSLSRRFGERLDSLPDSRLSTHDSPAFTRDSSLAAHTSPAPSPVHPGYLAHADLCEIYRERQKPDFHLPLRLYNKALAWQHYTAATGIQSPYNLNWAELTARKPPEADAPDPPIPDLDELLSAAPPPQAPTTITADNATAEDG